MDGDLPATSLERLAMFPLPDVVMFPGTIMPLHIFEERYREMTRDALAGDRLLAIARLRPGYEGDYYGRPPVFDTCGIGVIVADDELEDGRYNIVLRGVGRVAIEEELPPEESYRVIRARLLPDTDTARPELVTGAHGQLVALCDRLAASLGEAGERLQNLVRATPTPAVCADVVAAAVVMDADERQKLLEALDPADRLDTVLEHVTRLIAKFGPTTDVLN